MSGRTGRPAEIIQIFVSLYKLHVIVTWGTSEQQIVNYARGRGLKLSDRWRKEFRDTAAQPCTGFTMALGENNTDIFVWLRRRPRKAPEYGALYHELHHAVYRIARSHSLGEEDEAQAYLYEYLATQCIQTLRSFR